MNLQLALHLQTGQSVFYVKKLRLRNCSALLNPHAMTSGAGYPTLAENIERFSELNHLPIEIDVSRLDEGTGISDTLQQHQAMWHTSCKDKFNSTKLKRAEKRAQSTISTLPKKYTRLIGPDSEIYTELCFFCDTETGDPLRNASTFQLDSRVRKCALELQDDRLLAKLSAGDMVALEAKCLVAYYRKANEVQKTEERSNYEKVCHAIAFAELAAYLDDLRSEEDSRYVIKLAELTKMYVSWLERLGIEQLSRVRSTTLKTRILAQFPDISEYKEGRDILLAFNKDIGLSLKKAYNYNYNGDGGAIGLTQNPELLQRWMIAGPEVARIICEFESYLKQHHNLFEGTCHHEQSKATQTAFTNHVKAMVEVMEEMGNPFADNGSELYRTDTKEVLGEDAIYSVNNIEKIGQDQYEEYIASCLVGDKPISDPIKKNKLCVQQASSTKTIKRFSESFSLEE